MGGKKECIHIQGLQIQNHNKVYFIPKSVGMRLGQYSSSLPFTLTSIKETQADIQNYSVCIVINKN